VIPLHFRPAPTYTIEWTANCPCGEPDATWGQDPKGTGVADPVIYCPRCNPRRTVALA
jgi:hypothetical protein